MPHFLATPGVLALLLAGRCSAAGAKPKHLDRDAHEQTTASVARAAWREQQEEARSAVASFHKTHRVRQQVAIKLDTQTMEQEAEERREAAEKASKIAAAKLAAANAVKARAKATREFAAHLRRTQAEMHAAAEEREKEDREEDQEEEHEEEVADVDTPEEAPTRSPPTAAERAEREEEEREREEKALKHQAEQQKAQAEMTKHAEEVAKREDDMQKLASDVHAAGERGHLAETAEEVHGDVLSASESAHDSEASTSEMFGTETKAAVAAARKVDEVPSMDSDVHAQKVAGEVDAMEAQAHRMAEEEEQPKSVAVATEKRRRTEEELHEEADMVHDDVGPGISGATVAGVKADEEEEHRELREVRAVKIERQTLVPGGPGMDAAIPRPTSMFRKTDVSREYKLKQEAEDAVRMETGREMKIQRKAEVAMDSARNMRAKLHALEAQE